jgi:hypothetical protein
VEEEQRITSSADRRSLLYKAEGLEGAMEEFFKEYSIMHACESIGVASPGCYGNKRLVVLYPVSSRICEVVRDNRAERKIARITSNGSFDLYENERHAYLVSFSAEWQRHL